MAKTLRFVFALGHFVACFWYCMGAQVDEEENRCVIACGWKNAGVIVRYTMSLHCAIVQFGGGMSEVTPENVPQRVYAIAISS